MSSIEVRVPNIGGFKDVGIIEVMVKPGDDVKVDASLVTLESDKATMEVPSPHAGKVREVKVKVGDRVSEGSVLVLLESAEQAPAGAPVAAAPAPKVSTPVDGPSARAKAEQRPARRHGVPPF